MTVRSILEKFGFKTYRPYSEQVLDLHIPEGYTAIAVRPNKTGELWLFSDFHKTKSDHRGVNGVDPNYTWNALGDVIILKKSSYIND